MHVIVIGAGLNGVCTAYFLRRHGCEVTVVDRQSGPAMETSFANGGMLTPSQAHPWNEPGVAVKLLKWIGREDSPFLLRPRALPHLLGWGLRFLGNSLPARHRYNAMRNAVLGAYNLRELDTLRTQAALHYTGARLGTMKLSRDHATLDHLAALSAQLAPQGLRYEVLDRRATVAVEPALETIADQLAGAIYYPDDEAGDAHEFCVALAERARREGVDFQHATTVQALRCEQGRFHAIETSAGSLSADACVIAAGSYTPLLARAVGVRVPVRPVKGYSLSIAMQGWNGPPRVPLVDEGLHIAATPLGERLRIAGTAEFTGYDLSLPERRVEHLFRVARELYPALAGIVDRAGIDPWCGLRPMSCDGVPILGTTPIDKLYLNTGHGHLGWTLCVGSGRIVADVVTGQGAAIDPAPYALARF
ncbi:MAG: D-amino acid dehydrogenase [Gammaproteobacteria bacterium]|nr:D-amino acid dehydrogenase [Gammaproteobacteria bacterium]